MQGVSAIFNIPITPYTKHEQEAQEVKMRHIKGIAAVLALVVLMAVSVSAQPELPDPGITPDSPFYFMDRIFSVFKSAEALADERAAEIVAMAQKGHERGLTKAMEGYEKALEKRHRQAEKDENVAEEVARQSSNHLAVLARVREQVPEQAKAGIDRALTEGAKGRENALQALNATNPERAGAVAEATLQEVIANAPEQAQAGLQRALEAVRAGRPSAAESGEAGGFPAQDREGAPEERGRPSDLPVGEEEDAEEREREAREEAEEREAEARERAGEAGASTEEETSAREEGSAREESARESAGGRP